MTNHNLSSFQRMLSLDGIPAIIDMDNYYVITNRLKIKDKYPNASYGRGVPYKKDIQLGDYWYYKSEHSSVYIHIVAEIGDGEECIYSIRSQITVPNGDIKRLHTLLDEYDIMRSIIQLSMI